jgi:hypothetical protein
MTKMKLPLSERLIVAKHGDAGYHTCPLSAVEGDSYRARLIHVQQTKTKG